MDSSRASHDEQVYSQQFHVPPATGQYPPSDGMAQTTLPPSDLTFNASPMPAPATWADQQLVYGIALDLQTPSLDDPNPSATAWNASLAQTAASSSTTPELAAPTLPGLSTAAMPSFDASMSLSPPQILVGNSTAFPITSRLRNQSVNQTPSNREQTQRPSSVGARQSAHGLRNIQSADNMSTSRQSLSQRPSSSEGATRPSSASKRSNDPHDERMDFVSDGGSEEDEKLKISRERNRIAAAKTRRKKKRSAKEIEDRAREIEQTNTLLHHEVRVLRDEFSTLRYCALSHDPTAGCKCTPLHRYNEHKAKEIAEEVAKGI
ncbi:hypothetical protein CKM354_000181400 [Cercospora kikuchii]|uniref:BZIP domain-containing protein n=1 Tax=Cercospora kikuchii TaxID=84275 RepID=A0A9P3C8Y9_9PEZI|nr:uncharacterized protein CKM354_000181400 [Cercospora kikuchii]GIZ38396.1 hypothetical protein CKM354_000181400 [Cercospora kikuchii]